MTDAHTTKPRLIAHTSEPTRKPWPEDVLIQGSTWFYRGGQRHEACFVEAFPPRTFMRAEAPTLADAEVELWDRYQHMLACETAPDHGPFEARHYTNGSGHCTTCGTWLSHVLPATSSPTDEAVTSEQFFLMLSQHLPPAIGDLLAVHPDA